MMKLTKKALTLLCLTSLLVGCPSSETEQSHGGETHTQANNKTEKPADTPPAKTETTSTKAVSDSSSKELTALCEKLSTEMKAMGAPEQMANMTLESCKTSAKAYNNNHEAAEAYLGHLNKTCEGKSGQEWFNCYSKEAQTAADMAAKFLPKAGDMTVKTESAAEQPAAPQNETKPANEQPEKPATQTESSSSGDGYTIATLCKKLVSEMRGMGMPESALDQSLKGCEKSSESYKGPDLHAFVKHIMDACDGKSGQDWFGCYSTEAQVAAQKMGVQNH